MAAGSIVGSGFEHVAACVASAVGCRAEPRSAVGMKAKAEMLFPDLVLTVMPGISSEIALLCGSILRLVKVHRAPEVIRRASCMNHRYERRAA
jgi:hypothetical protein